MLKDSNRFLDVEVRKQTNGALFKNSLRFQEIPQKQLNHNNTTKSFKFKMKIEISEKIYQMYDVNETLEFSTPKPNDFFTNKFLLFKVPGKFPQCIPQKRLYCNKSSDQLNINIFIYILPLFYPTIVE